jgi:hypothetical protein
MPDAFDTKEKAHAYLTKLGGAKINWSAKLAVQQEWARHSLTNVYANGQYVGSFQLSTLGPAFYYHAKEAGYAEGPVIQLTWGNMNDALIMTYSTRMPWGPWICHDYTAYLFKTWGGTPSQSSNSSPTSNGSFLYWGGRGLGLLAWPGTGAMMAVHKGWNGVQDGARAAGNAANEGMQNLQRAFSNIGRPGAWRW